MPLFGCTPPQIGQSISLTLSNGTPNASGFVYGSGIPTTSIPLGSGCEVQLDLGSFVPVFPVATDGTGTWGLGLLIPPDPGLVGASAVLQIALFNTSGPFGFDLSNGLIAQIGY